LVTVAGGMLIDIIAWRPAPQAAGSWPAAEESGPVSRVPQWLMRGTAIRKSAYQERAASTGEVKSLRSRLISC
jgi:hypothetical protein